MTSLMLVGTPLIFRILIFLPLLVGCALFQENKGPKPVFGPRQQIYYSEFDKVWLATQRAVQDYPIRVNNMDLGVIETSYIKGYKAWVPPHLKKNYSGGYKYRLSVRIIRGDVKRDAAIKVSITKEIELKSDFFAEPRKRPSDGLEEAALLYRIGREIQIERALEKAQTKMNKSG